MHLNIDVNTNKVFKILSGVVVDTILLMLHILHQYLLLTSLISEKMLKSKNMSKHYFSSCLSFLYSGESSKENVMESIC